MKQIFIFLTQIFNLICFGLNGTYQVAATANPSFTNLLVQINSIGTTEATVNINKTLTLTSSITIPNNIGLKFYKGAVFKLNGFTLTINGSIDAGVFQIFSGTSIVNGKPKIERTLTHWFKKPNSNFNDDIDWRPTIQKAVDFYPKVMFPAMNIVGGSKESENAYHIRSTIKLDVSKSGIVLTGFGTRSILITYLTRQSTYGNFKGYVFECINSSAEKYPFRNGLVIKNLTVFCDNGIKVSLIDISDFTNISGQQNQNNIISRVKINGYKFINHQTDRSFKAISMVKVFDSEISNNYIQGFTTGILLEGCDLNTVRDNNVLNLSKYAICDLAYGDFGSQNMIIHNGLLDFRGNASNKGAFIKSNSRHIIIRDNYLESNEQAHQLFVYIDCSKVSLPC